MMTIIEEEAKVEYASMLAHIVLGVHMSHLSAAFQEMHGKKAGILGPWRWGARTKENSIT